MRPLQYGIINGALTMRSAWFRALNLTGPALVAIMSAFFITGLGGIAFSQDTDGDQMPDSFELFYGLDPNKANDANKDYDGDQLQNLAESVLWTDPYAWDTDRDQLSDLIESNAAAYAISRAWTPLGKGQFIYNGNEMVYARPGWALAVVKDEDSAWWTNAAGRTAWHVSAALTNGAGALWLVVDRAIVTNDLRLMLAFQDQGELYLDLAATNGMILQSNLFSNLVSGTGLEKTVTWSLPLAAEAEAAVILLRRGVSGAGEVTVYESQLYIDLDADSLDDQAERFYGTSDLDADSDDDGLPDGAEALTYGTDPRNADSDNDGMNDGWEVLNGLNPTINDAEIDSDGDGASNLTEYMQGRDPQAGAIADTNAIVNLKVFTLLE